MKSAMSRSLVYARRRCAIDLGLLDHSNAKCHAIQLTHTRFDISAVHGDHTRRRLLRMREIDEGFGDFAGVDFAAEEIAAHIVFLGKAAKSTPAKSPKPSSI